jgi:hypothetical protein
MRGLSIGIFLLFFGLVGCNSVATYQAHLQKELTPEQQKKDIRFAQKKKSINYIQASIGICQKELLTIRWIVWLKQQKVLKNQTISFFS